MRYDHRHSRAVTCYWPTSGTVEAYVINFMDTIKYLMESPDAYLIFEGTSETVQSRWRYPVDQAMVLVESTNSAFTRHCPPRTWLSTYCTTRYSLINFICHYLINPNPTPVQVWNSFSIQREHLTTNHEEADVIIVHHLVRIASEASDDSYGM